MNQHEQSASGTTFQGINERLHTINWERTGVFTLALLLAPHSCPL